jgi:acyl-CoA reductase-like NAD-dependent aldehyde dehydrogenase
VITCYDPHTGSVCDRIPESSWEDALNFFENAKSYQQEFRNISYQEKSKWLDDFCSNLLKQQEEAATILSKEVGKPFRESLGEIQATVPRIKWFIKESENFLAPTTMLNSAKSEEKISYDPLGIILNISAWNFPYFLSSNIFAPAILTGNILLYKGSEVCPKTASFMTDLLYKSGVPEKAFYSFTAGPDLSSKLSELNFDGLFFTGSKKTGISLAKKYSSKLIPITMELGGKDAAYVHSDSLDSKTVDSLVSGAYYNAGQSCCSIERIYVQENIYEDFIKEFAKKTKLLVTGDPFSKQTTLGSLSRKEQIEVLDSQRKDAMAKGARCLLEGGRQKSSSGWHYSPCLLVDCSQDMLVMQEESFGPIVGIQKVKNKEQAIKQINSSEYGLTASIYTKDKNLALDFLQCLDVGTVYWNACDRVSPYVPWSGRKNSGVGSSLSYQGIRSFLKPKAWQLC